MARNTEVRGHVSSNKQNKSKENGNLVENKETLGNRNIYSTLMLLHNIVGLVPSELLQNPVLIVLRLIREVLVFVLNHTTVTEFLL